MTAALEGDEWPAVSPGRPRETPVTHCTGGWVGLRAGLDGRKISSHQDSIPDRPAPSQSLYRLSYRAHIQNITNVYFIGTSSIHLSGVWRDSLHDLCLKFAMCLVVSPLRVEKPKKTNMLSRTFGHQLPVKWHHNAGKKGDCLYSVGESL